MVEDENKVVGREADTEEPKHYSSWHAILSLQISSGDFQVKAGRGPLTSVMFPGHWGSCSVESPWFRFSWILWKTHWIFYHLLTKILILYKYRSINMVKEDGPSPRGWSLIGPNQIRSSWCFSHIRDGYVIQFWPMTWEEATLLERFSCLREKLEKCPLTLLRT